MAPEETNGFTAVRLKQNETSGDSHELYIKEHSVRNFDETKPSGRTLFALNIPPYVTAPILRHVFTQAGKIESIQLQSTESAFQTAYIVFTKTVGLAKALKLTSLELTSPPLTTGLGKWIDEYNAQIYDHGQLNDEVTSYITRLDQRLEGEGGKKSADDDGWTTVSKKGRKPGLQRKESVENKLIAKNRIKSKKKELKNFYTFQMKEEKMKNIVALRKSYQESREKVQAMKEMRNFKPL